MAHTSICATLPSSKTNSRIVQELRDYLSAPGHEQFNKDFEAAFQAVLDSGIKEPEEFGIKTVNDLLNWYEDLLTWIPYEHKDGAFTYHIICFFYFIMNKAPLVGWTSPIVPATKPPYTWLSEWVVRYNKEMGKFLDTPESITETSLQTFRNAPRYRMSDYIEPEGGWRTFNQFFARHIKPELRPITDPASNLTIVNPADAAFDGSWGVDDGEDCLLKGIPWPIKELLDDSHNPNGQDYGDMFAGGQFCHAFLNTTDYHRQHAPVSGKVIEARVIEGLCYLQVGVEKDMNGRLTVAPHRKLHGHPPGLAQVGVEVTAPDTPGYQFIQARALILIDTPDIGMVAVLPIGMAMVSSVLLSVKPGDVVKKGDEISYFQFGGSDIVMVFQKKANVTFTAGLTTHYNFGEKVAEANPQ